MSHAALAGLAELAYNQGDFGRAVLSAKRAVAIAPRAVAYRMTLAKSYFKLLRYDDAIAQWKGVLAIDPGNAAAAKHIEMANSKR
jgi:tetratricopeptide (TPR) repeat protein